MFNNITITDVKEIFTVFSPKGRFEKISNRRSFGLSFCIDGQITYLHNGKRTVSDKNHAVILPQGQTYTLFGDKSGSFTVINFTCTEKFCDTVISVPIQNTDAYINDFERIRSLSFFDTNRAETMSIFYHMLHRLSLQSSSFEIIMPAIKYLEENYQNSDLSNTELANICKISEIYFRRIFKECFNTTPKQFLVDTRINNAKRLLSEGALKINAVATKCGFTNQYHFCRTFKKKTGLTPTEYMEQNRIYKI